ncbi:hypothetical protein NPX13_g8161 [Xylaria arbuscula]|uniref:Alcohol dehydrogenase-like N-terminal domain-containing protein n=1 Tax=Xylaria arbuscula TaxID=114810 RepID=A0A9W8N998_9PEZI|nr:hypothetical protein NPX13_g8161 [Xylaria arbuscula]
MKQWVTNQDGLDKLRLIEVTEPTELKEGEVLVEIHSVSLNYRDTEGMSISTNPCSYENPVGKAKETLVCMGLYGHHKSINNETEVVPTSDSCGQVVGVSPGGNESGLKKGDRVASIFNQTHVTGQVTAKDMVSSPVDSF